MTTVRSGRPWTSYALGVLCVGAIVAAILLVGPASGSQTGEGRTITVGEGVVQSTVSGSGNVQAASELDLGFKTSGVVSEIDVSQGQHVTEGQLIAELDPESAEVTLEQAKANLQAAEAKLVEEQETDGETGTDAGSGASGSGASATAAAADAEASAASTTATPADTDAAAAVAPAGTSASGGEPAKTTLSSAAPSTPAPTTQTTPAATTPTPSTATKTTSGKAKGPADARTDDSSQRTGSTRSEGSSTDTGTTQGTSSTTGSTAAKATVSAALREANLASAKAAVRSDALAVQNDEKALANTKLLAPQTGTIVSLAGEVGETVAGGGTTKSSSTGSSGSGSGASAASSTGAGASADGSSSSGSGSSSSSFAVLSDLDSMQLVVPLSESEVGGVRAGQPATVTVEALESAKLAAHVVSVATLPTSTSGVVSYDVTFQLDQLASGLKPGMSATAEVVVKQAEGVNVPTTAISADTVTVVRGGKQVRERVVTGLAGDSSTIVLSGLKAGEEIVLPVARNSASSLASRLGGALSSRLGGGTLGGAGGLAGAGAAPGGFAGGGGFRGG